MNDRCNWVWNRESSHVIGNTYCKYLFFDENKPVVITFAPFSNKLNRDIIEGKKSPWGYDFIISRGLNVISFCPIEVNDWYRSKDLKEYIVVLSAFLEKFNRRLGYGGSMGAFAVSTFANELNLDSILLYNPFSSLNEDIVPWETRFKNYRSLNWTDGFYDGAKANCEGFIVYDPLFSLDSKHAHRYDRLVHLKIPGVGHGIPRHLQSMGLLKSVFLSFVYGELEPNSFHRKVRKRRNIARYYNWLLSDQNGHLTPSREKIIKKHFDSFKVKAKDISIPDKKQIDLIRDTALKLEEQDMSSALALMEIARMLRPDGDFINKKIKFYKKHIVQ